jgi:excisionase family DNA binding protein
VGEPRQYLNIAADLREKIGDGTFKPCDMVLLGELLQQHGVCRQTAAKALRVLAGEGLLDRYPGLGYFVRGEGGSPPHLAPVPARRRHDGDQGRQSAAMAEHYITAPELAARLRISSMTVHQLIHDGEIEGAIRIGANVIRIPESSVQAFLERSRIDGQHFDLDELAGEADGPSTGLDDGRSILVEPDGTITVYSADRSQYLLFQVLPSWEIDTIGLVTEPAAQAVESGACGQGPENG